jgi:hypothetical protein
MVHIETHDSRVLDRFEVVGTRRMGKVVAFVGTLKKNKK